MTWIKLAPGSVFLGGNQAQYRVNQLDNNREIKNIGLWYGAQLSLKQACICYKLVNKLACELTFISLCKLDRNCCCELVSSSQMLQAQYVSKISSFCFKNGACNLQARICEHILARNETASLFQLTWGASSFCSKISSSVPISSL